MTDFTSVFRPRLALMAFAAVGGAQLFFSRGVDHRTAGFVMIAVAIVLVLLEALVSRPDPGLHMLVEKARKRQATALEERSGKPTGAALDDVEAVRIRWRLVGIAITLAAINLWLLRSPTRDSYWEVWLLWSFSILFAMASLLGPWRRGLRGLGEIFEIDRLDVVIILVLTLLALLLRLSFLESVPPNLSGDEANWGLETMRVLSGELRNPFTFGRLGQPTLVFWASLPTMEWLGNSATAIRLPWALVGSLVPGIAYLLVSLMVGRSLAIMVGLFSALWSFTIHFSRMAFGSSPDAVLTTLCVLLFVGAGRSSKRNDLASQRAAPVLWGCCGACAGLSLYAYTAARLAFVLVLVLTAIRLLPRLRRVGRVPRSFAWLGAMLLMFLVTAAPMIQLGMERPDDFNARWGASGIFGSGWLEREVVITGQPKWQLIGEQAARSLLAFNLYPDSSTHFASRRPLLSPIAGSFFLLGLISCTVRFRQRTFQPWLLWWWGGLLGSILTTSPPAAPRFMVVSVPTCFFLAIGLWSVCRALFVGRSANRSGLSARTAAFGIIGSLGLLSAIDYFAVLTPQRLAGNPHSVVATELGHWLKQEYPAGADLVFLGAPAMYSGFPTLPFLAPRVHSSDVLEPLRPGQDLSTFCRPNVSNPRVTIFVALPDRLEELSVVESTFLGSTREDVPWPTQDDRPRLLYSRVRVDSCSVPAVPHD